MGLYSVNGFSAATAGSVGAEPIFSIWNPDSAQRICLREIGYYQAGTVGPRIILRRTTARGTAGSTVTPGADNAWNADDVPPSGWVMDLSSFSVLPTYLPVGAGVTCHRQSGGTGSAGAGAVFQFDRDLWIAPGKGIAMVTGAAAAMGTCQCYAVVEEG